MDPTYRPNERKIDSVTQSEKVIEDSVQTGRVRDRERECVCERKREGGREKLIAWMSVNMRGQYGRNKLSENMKQQKKI